VKVLKQQPNTLSMKPDKSNNSSSLSKSKRMIFNLILVLLPFILVLFIELLLRMFSYGDDLRLFINNTDKEYQAYKIVNTQIGKKYFQKFEYTSPPRDIFLKEKPDSCFRVFVMGSSSTAGFPYDNNIMFSRILHEWLRETYPGKKIEVVNTAITAINSFTLLDFMPQILREKPDAILFYAGHNEFYGAFGAGSNEAVTHNPALIRLHLRMMDMKIYQLTRNIISGVTAMFQKTDTAAAKRGTLMTRIVKDADIVYDSDIYREGINNYHDNLEMMLAMTKGKKVPVFISDLVSNIRDMEPFNSKATDKYKPAIVYYREAQRLEATENFQAAKENYTTARDYDCIRFRASSDINKVIVDLSKKYSNVHFVPSLSLFEANSPNKLIGLNLITEHLHPNIEGYFLLAESFYGELMKSGIINGAINEYAPKTARQFMTGYGFTVLDSLVGMHRVSNLNYHWPFRDETNGFIDYRKIYKPVSHLDSIAFFVMVDKNTTLPDAHLQLAKEYEKEYNYLSAFREYNALVTTDPYWPQYFRKAADCLLAISDLPGAIRYFNRSLEFGEPSFYAHFRLGELFMIKNDIAKAIDHFEAALKLADKEKLNVLAKLYISYSYKKDNDNVERIGQEIQKLKTGVKLQVPPREYLFMDYIPVQVNDYISKAEELLKNAKIDEAKTLFLESLEVKDNHIAHRRLGEIYFKEKNFQKALFELKMVYNDFDADPKFLHLLALIYLSEGNRTAAEKYIDRIRDVDPEYSGLEKLESYI
jgi:tetratricopeptide (TPR) repeat protein